MVDSEYIVHKGIPTLGGVDEKKVSHWTTSPAFKFQRTPKLKPLALISEVIFTCVFDLFGFPVKTEDIWFYHWCLTLSFNFFSC